MRKMKKYIVCCVAVLLIATAIVLVLQNRKSQPGNLYLGEYQWYVKNFPSDTCLGKIENAETAIQKAESLWTEIYGQEVASKKPYIASYDAANQVWLVHGSLPTGTVGGAPYLLVENETGDVLAVWHDK